MILLNHSRTLNLDNFWFKQAALNFLRKRIKLISRKGTGINYYIIMTFFKFFINSLISIKNINPLSLAFRLVTWFKKYLIDKKLGWETTYNSFYFLGLLVFYLFFFFFVIREVFLCCLIYFLLYFFFYWLFYSIKKIFYLSLYHFW